MQIGSKSISVQSGFEVSTATKMEETTGTVASHQEGVQVKLTLASGIKDVNQKTMSFQFGKRAGFSCFKC